MRQLYQSLRVAPSAYHAWQQRTQPPVPAPVWQLTVPQAFDWHGRRYGTRHLRAEVRAEDHELDCWRIRLALKTRGLCAQQPRAFVPRTTEPNPAVRAASKRLLS